MDGYGLGVLSSLYICLSVLLYAVFQCFCMSVCLPFWSVCRGMEKNYFYKYTVFPPEYSEKLTSGDMCFNLTDGSSQQQCLFYLGKFWSTTNISVYEACRQVMHRFIVNTSSFFVCFLLPFDLLSSSSPSFLASICCCQYYFWWDSILPAGSNSQLSNIRQCSRGCVLEISYVDILFLHLVSLSCCCITSQVYECHERCMPAINYMNILCSDLVILYVGPYPHSQVLECSEGCMPAISYINILFSVLVCFTCWSKPSQVSERSCCLPEPCQWLQRRREPAIPHGLSVLRLHLLQAERHINWRWCQHIQHL